LSTPTDLQQRGWDKLIGVPIGYNDLRAGDMLLYHNAADPTNGSHVVLFDHWTGTVGGDFIIYEQTPPYPMHRAWSQTGYSRSLYKPYRYVNAVVNPASLSGDSRAEVLSVAGNVYAYYNYDGINFSWGPPTLVGTGWTDPSRTRFADLNGDGRSEIIAIDANGELRAFPNIDGINFSWGSARVVGAGWYDPARVRFADLDGDGRDEVISIDTNGELRAFPNIDGINFSWGSARVVGTGWYDPARVRFADLDGDGRDEVISIDTNGELRAFPNIDGINFSWGSARVVGTGWYDPSATFFA
jgi:hypothetical protein